MKLSIVPLLSAATISLTLVVKPELQLQVEKPDTRFDIQLLFDSPLLPVNSTLAVITYFMGSMARSDFERVLEPTVYRSRKYPTVTITSHSSTEARFLLWGIYLAAIDMVKYIRFNDVVVNLLWKKQLVGQISVLVNTAESQPSTSLIDTNGFIDNRESLSLATVSNTTDEASVGKPNVRTPESGTRTANPTHNASAASFVDTWSTECSNPSALPISHCGNASLLSTLAVDFQSVAGAISLKRNDVFLSFYAALLHVARFPAGDQLQRFDSRAPDVELRVHMFHIGIGCSYGQVISALLYVPVYMMEHPAFGYKETNFNVRLGWVRACRGALLDENLLQAG